MLHSRLLVGVERDDRPGRLHEGPVQLVQELGRLAALLGAVCLPLLLNLDALAVQHLHEAAEEVEDAEDRRRIEFRTLEAHAPHRLGDHGPLDAVVGRSEEHTSELQSLMRNSYAVFCLKKKTKEIMNDSS